MPKALITNIKEGVSEVCLDRLNSGETLYWQNGRVSETEPESGDFQVVCPDKSLKPKDKAQDCGPVRLHLKVSVTHASGCTSPTGEIALAPSLGAAPYRFSWSTGATSADLKDLFPGVYSCTVTDRLGNTEALQALEVRTADRKACPEQQSASKNKMNSDFYYFPNPAASSLTVVMQGEFSECRLLDQTGKLIRAFSTQGFEKGSLNFDLNDLQAGIYFIALTKADGSIQSKRFVVAR